MPVTAYYSQAYDIFVNSEFCFAERLKTSSIKLDSRKMHLNFKPYQKKQVLEFGSNSQP